MVSSRLLNEGEHVVVSTRTHVKALLLPAVLLIVVAAVAGFVSSFTGGGGNAQPLLLAVVWGIALLVVLWLVVRPFLRWLTTTYTLTDRRLITRTGILSRRGHDIPVSRISDVAYEHSLLDRVLGCGTLLISDATDRGTVRLDDVPQVERVHLQITDLLYRGEDHDDFGREDDRFDDGT